MLLGAAKLTTLLETRHAGNLINYTKDSTYLHIRNLYNFFAADARNDAKVTQFTSHTFNLSLYTIWKSALHDHAAHIKTSRHSPTNVIAGVHLNEKIQDFAIDIEALWTEWINNTSDQNLKIQLTDALASSRTAAQADYDYLDKKLSTS